MVLQDLLALLLKRARPRRSGRRPPRGDRGSRAPRPPPSFDLRHRRRPATAILVALEQSASLLARDAGRLRGEVEVERFLSQPARGEHPFLGGAVEVLARLAGEVAPGEAGHDGG